MDLRSRRLLPGCLIVLAIAALASCSWTAYVDRNLSASAYLERLTGRSARGATTGEISQALLLRLPSDTTEQEIYTYLEQHGLEQDRFRNGQFMRYQRKNPRGTIVALLSDPPYRLNIACQGWGYNIFFQLDPQGQLDDIRTETRGACL